MVESIVTVVLEVAKCLAPWAERQLSYVRNYDSNIENLKREAAKLKAESATVQHRVDEAQRNGKQIEENVRMWLGNVNGIINEQEKFIEDEENANKQCFRRLCPNLRTRYQMSKKAETHVRSIARLCEEAGRFREVSYSTIPNEIWLTSNKDYEAFQSRMSVLKILQDAISDPSVSTIGVYGMGGVGKTTLVKEVARYAGQEKFFDKVVFVEVSQTADIGKIQDEIAEKLGMELSDKTISQRANRLWERVKKEKKILIVLDNIWKYLNLEIVGIPYGDNHKGCKILMTARHRDVLLSMGSKDNFCIGVLNGEEAWRLFKRMAGDDVENRELKSIATDITKACGGLPIAITTIARALRKKSLPEWKNALRELQMPSSENFERVPAEAYLTIELSYNYLKSEQLKKMFLLCSLQAGYCDIFDLLKYGMGLGIFQGVGRMEDARNKLYALIHELRDCCLLLEDGGSDNYFMHDVIRDVAISIACRDRHVFAVRNENMWEWPDLEALKECTAISLRGTNILELPPVLECPQLEFLFIIANDIVVKIPENFFTGMRKLKVIDFSRMQLFSLPSLIHQLESLTTLCLDQSALGDITIIGKLKNLEVLSFLKSDIVKLPEELGQLTKLRLLDLRDCSKLKVIAPNVLSSLTRLEELHMCNCFVVWEIVGPNCERSNASLEELMHLSRLTCLEIQIKNDDILPEGFLSKKLERYKISVGDGSFKHSLDLQFVDKWFRFNQWYLHDKYETSRELKLKLNSKNVCLESFQLVQTVEYLCLDKLEGVKNVLFELTTEGLIQLKHLHVQNNFDLLCVFGSMEESFDIFPLLESLTFRNLISMEKVCHGQLKVGSFSELNTITVEECHSLRYILWLSSTKCLPRLERIAVINCKGMQKVFTIGGGSDAGNIEEIDFAKLKSISLGNLPDLTSFYSELIQGPSLPENIHEELLANTEASETDSIERLDTSLTLFNEKGVFPNLEALELYEINVQNIWPNGLPAKSSYCFRNMSRLIMWKCHRLKYIFSSSMVRSFEWLQHLEICDCQDLQEIIGKDEGGDPDNPRFEFPQMTSLILGNLPELRCFYSGIHTSDWPVLTKLEAYSCNNVKTFASKLFGFRNGSEDKELNIPVQQHLFLVEKVFPNLEGLALSRKDIPMICHDEFPENLLDRLKVLKVRNDGLDDGLQINFFQKFHNLEELILIGSSEPFSNRAEVEKHVAKLAQIKILRLFDLVSQNPWTKDSEVDSIFQNLETLELVCCHNLTNRFPSSASFPNLTHLHVHHGPALTNLMTSFTAKSLVQLVKMEICTCDRMTEVVASDEEEAAKGVIIFGKLRILSLNNLESLTSFCSSFYTFKFPSLRKLVVDGCPKMKIFAPGELSTPRLQVVERGEVDEWHWDGDLNTTIRQLYERKRQLIESATCSSETY